MMKRYLLRQPSDGSGDFVIPTPHEKALWPCLSSLKSSLSLSPPLMSSSSWLLSFNAIRFSSFTQHDSGLVLKRQESTPLHSKSMHRSTSVASILQFLQYLGLVLHGIKTLIFVWASSNIEELIDQFETPSFYVALASLWINYRFPRYALGTWMRKKLKKNFTLVK